jgi:hypothetical protein
VVISLTVCESGVKSDNSDSMAEANQRLCIFGVPNRRNLVVNPKLQSFAHHVLLKVGKAMLGMKGLRLFVLGFRLEGQQNRTDLLSSHLNKREAGPAIRQFGPRVQSSRPARLTGRIEFDTIKFQAGLEVVQDRFKLHGCTSLDISPSSLPVMLGRVRTKARAEPSFTHVLWRPA